MNTQREVIYAQRQKVLDGEDLRENMMQMLRSLVESDVSTALSGHGGEVNEDGLKGLANAMEGIVLRQRHAGVPPGAAAGHECRPADGHRF